MRAKPEMKPWVHRYKTKNELRRSGTTARVLAFTLGCAAPLGLNKCWLTINPGLAPWAMKMYRPKGLLYVFPVIILYYFDAGTLTFLLEPKKI